MSSASESLITSLQTPALYDHPVVSFSVLETHISWVLLTGPYAYKLKKPVDFGFVDFSTLEKRHFYCQEELRLNRRLAPDLYLDVVTVSGSKESPSFENAGPAIEYAVKMRQFPQDALLCQVAARGELRRAHIDQMADVIAAFHERIDTADPESSFGAPEQVHRWAVQNFEQIRPLLRQQNHRDQLASLQLWTERERERRDSRLRERKRQGFIRDCHGDMHLGNMTLIDGRVTIFDCIEFNQELRWIDVMSELAFVVMDLHDRGHKGLAFRLLDHYLPITGDYNGLGVLPYYLVYRALVRAKVGLLRLGQGGLTEPETVAILEEYQGYIDLALDYSRQPSPALIITHGLAGSGKSTVAEQLVESLGAVRIRSDVERKRLFGFRPEAETQSGLQAGIYTPDAGRRTYERVAELAASVIEAGYPAIADVACLQRWQRDVFRALARRLGVPWLIIDCQAPEELLRQRIRQRQRERQDPSEAGLEVLDNQLRTRDRLAGDERSDVLILNTAAASASAGLATAIGEKMRRLGSLRD